MSSNVNAAQPFDGSTEIHAVSDIGISLHSIIRSLIAAGRSLSLRQSDCKPSACHGGKLTALIDDSNHRVRIDGAKYTINNDRTYRQLSGIALTAGFAINEIRKKIPVSLRKAYLGNISPCRLRRQLGESDFFSKLRLKLGNIFFLLLYALLICQSISFRL